MSTSYHVYIGPMLAIKAKPMQVLKPVIICEQCDMPKGTYVDKEPLKFGKFCTECGMRKVSAKEVVNEIPKMDQQVVYDLFEDSLDLIFQEDFKPMQKDEFILKPGWTRNPKNELKVGGDGMQFYLIDLIDRDYRAEMIQFEKEYAKEISIARERFGFGTISTMWGFANYVS